MPVAGLVCLKAEARGRLYYRVRVHRGRKGERRSMSEADYAGVADANRACQSMWDCYELGCGVDHETFEAEDGCPLGWLVPHPACVTAQHRILVPQHRILVPERQQLSIPRLVSAEHQDSQAE